MPSKVPEQFKKLTNYLVDQKMEIGIGIHNEAQRPWLDFQEMSGPVGNFDQEMSGPVGNFDIKGLRANFNRKTANDDYVNAKQDKEATDASIAVPKLAADFMAACERDFADMRKRSRIRMMVHAGVRDRNNGNSVTGSLALGTLRFVSAIENIKNVGESGA
jgi:hypothetical protein